MITIIHVKNPLAILYFTKVWEVPGPLFESDCKREENVDDYKDPKETGCMRVPWGKQRENDATTSKSSPLC